VIDQKANVVSLDRFRLKTDVVELIRATDADANALRVLRTGIEELDEVNRRGAIESLKPFLPAIVGMRNEIKLFVKLLAEAP
jgi:hypothetical protein